MVEGRLDLARRFENSAAVVIDECHRMASRFLGASRRSQTFEESPAIWTACLSATLLGNHGLDALAFHDERRASLFMSPVFTAAMSEVIRRERTRTATSPLPAAAIATARSGMPMPFPEVPARQPPTSPEGGPKDRETAWSGVAISADAQRELATALAPCVCRRTRACIGESPQPGDHRFPLVRGLRVAPRLTWHQRQVIAEVVELGGRISGGRSCRRPSSRGSARRG